MRKVTLPALTLLLVGLDQLSKWWIVANLEQNSLRPFLPGVFSLTYVRNYGAAFSMLQNQQWLFSLVTVLVLSFAVYYLFKHLSASIWLLLGLVLIIAGGLGNFIDRLRLGYVVDMVHLDFMDFAIFNVADSYLTVGVILLILTLWKED